MLIAQRRRRIQFVVGAEVQHAVLVIKNTLYPKGRYSRSFVFRVYLGVGQVERDERLELGGAVREHGHVAVAGAGRAHPQQRARAPQRGAAPAAATRVETAAADLRVGAY